MQAAFEIFDPAEINVEQPSAAVELKAGVEQHENDGHRVANSFVMKEEAEKEQSQQAFCSVGKDDSR